MTKYLIEVRQPTSVAAKCVEASVRTIGSHFATHAEWRHENGVAIGTLVVEADDRRWVIGVVPPNMRANARIFRADADIQAASSTPANFHENRSQLRIAA